ncbi:histidine phosphatase family protein [Enterobacteriaceae bacterium LUAb1]
MKKNIFALASLMMISTGVFAQLQGKTQGEVDVYFVRHGETIFNHYDRVQGWSDTPLTQSGAYVAKAFGTGSHTIKFDHYYSSDLGRQRETLALIMKAHNSQQQPVELQALREVFFGGFEGLPNETMVTAAGKVLKMTGKEAAELRQKGKLSLTAFTDAIHQVDDKGDAENAVQVKERMQQALETIVETALKNHERNVLVVSSGMSIGIMISDMTSDPLKNRGMGNAAVVKIEYRDGAYNVKDIGDMHYIKEGEAILKKAQ